MSGLKSTAAEIAAKVASNVFQKLSGPLDKALLETILSTYLSINAGKYFNGQHITSPAIKGQIATTLAFALLNSKVLFTPTETGIGIKFKAVTADEAIRSAYVNFGVIVLDSVMNKAMETTGATFSALRRSFSPRTSTKYTSPSQTTKEEDPLSRVEQQVQAMKDGKDKTFLLQQIDALRKYKQEAPTQKMYSSKL